MNNSIGGLDLVLKAPRREFDLALLADVVLDFWPRAVYHGAEETPPHPLGGVLANGRAALPQEFFVYRDEASWRQWDREGWTAANLNNMVHFLVSDDPEEEGLCQVTMVIDALNDEMADMYLAVSSTLHELLPENTGGRGRTRRLNFENELRAVGSSMSRTEFFELVDDIRQSLYPEWTQDELACHPHDALQFCAIARSRVGAPVPDNVIMKAMLNRRKRLRR